MCLFCYIHHHIIGHDAQGTVFRYAQKACGKEGFVVNVLFWIKNFNFYQNNTFTPIDFFMSSSMIHHS